MIVVVIIGILASAVGLVAGVGYFGMGLTNAMFGVLSQTVVYAVILALIAALGQLGWGETT